MGFELSRTLHSHLFFVTETKTKTVRLPSLPTLFGVNDYFIYRHDLIPRCRDSISGLQELTLALPTQQYSRPTPSPQGLPTIQSPLIPVYHHRMIWEWGGLSARPSKNSELVASGLNVKAYCFGTIIRFLGLRMIVASTPY